MPEPGLRRIARSDARAVSAIDVTSYPSRLYRHLQWHQADVSPNTGNTSDKRAASNALNVIDASGVAANELR
jgi:hypothetical protein